MRHKIEDKLNLTCKYALARIGCKYAIIKEFKKIPSTGPVPCIAPSVEIHKECPYRTQSKFK